jgi:hypothetical protein
MKKPPEVQNLKNHSLNNIMARKLMVFQIAVPVFHNKTVQTFHSVYFSLIGQAIHHFYIYVYYSTFVYNVKLFYHWTHKLFHDFMFLVFGCVSKILILSFWILASTRRLHLYFMVSEFIPWLNTKLKMVLQAYKNDGEIFKRRLETPGTCW